MIEDYRWKLQALAHDAREMSMVELDPDLGFRSLYPYLSELTEESRGKNSDDPRLLLPGLYWDPHRRKIPDRTVSNFPYQPAPKTLCEEAYRIVSRHLKVGEVLQLDPLSDVPCEAWFTRVVPHVLGADKAPPRTPPQWRFVELDSDQREALKVTAEALEKLAEQLDERGAAQSAGEGTSESDSPEETGGSLQGSAAKPNTVTLTRAREMFRRRVEQLGDYEYVGSLTDGALKQRLIRAVKRKYFTGWKDESDRWIFDLVSLEDYIERVVQGAVDKEEEEFTSP